MVSVSVILAVYNEEEDIRDCLDSLLLQDYDDFEIIVVDDGSTDRTYEMVKVYLERNRKVMMVSNKSNKGQTYSRNLGVLESQGEIIAFTDADCVLPKNWIQRIVDCFAGEEIVAASGPDITHPNDGVFARSVGLGIERGIGPVLRASNLAILRSSFLEVGGFDEGMRYNDEVDLQKRLYRRKLKILFSSAMMVHHKRATSVQGYFKQCFMAVRELFPIWMKHGVDYMILKPLMLITLLVLFTVLSLVPPLGLSTVSIAFSFLSLFVAWAWRGLPRTKALLLLPVIYFINYAGSLIGFFNGLTDYLVLPFMFSSDLGKWICKPSECRD